jgi:hypothetical protein
MRGVWCRVLCDVRRSCDGRVHSVRSTKENRASERKAEDGGGSPARKDYRLRQRRCRSRHFRAQGTPEVYGKVGNAMRQDNRILRGNG